MLESEAQRKRTADGGGFAAIVQRILNASLRNEVDQIVVSRARFEDIAAAIDNPFEARRLLDGLALNVRRPCDSLPVDVGNSGMLVALHHVDRRRWRVLAAIESSVSLHARHTEVCFWALALRSSCRFVFATEDRDIYSKHRSELGRSCQESTAGCMGERRMTRPGPVP